MQQMSRGSMVSCNSEYSSTSFIEQPESVCSMTMLWPGLLAGSLPDQSHLLTALDRRPRPWCSQGLSHPTHRGLQVHNKDIGNSLVLPGVCAPHS